MYETQQMMLITWWRLDRNPLGIASFHPSCAFHLLFYTNKTLGNSKKINLDEENGEEIF